LSSHRVKTLGLPQNTCIPFFLRFLTQYWIADMFADYVYCTFYIIWFWFVGGIIWGRSWFCF
jgi:hypothetical protein